MNENKTELLELLSNIQSIMHRHDRRTRMTNGPMGTPHRGQGRILSLLKMQPEMTQKELTYLLDMRPQSLGELLSKLEQKGFVTRTVSESDRRSINVKLTEAGLEVANQEAKPSDMEEIFDVLSEEEQVALMAYLERILASLEVKVGPSHSDVGDSDSGRGHRHHHHHDHGDGEGRGCGHKGRHGMKNGDDVTPGSHDHREKHHGHRSFVSKNEVGQTANSDQNNDSKE